MSEEPLHHESSSADEAASAASSVTNPNTTSTSGAASAPTPDLTSAKSSADYTALNATAEKSIKTKNSKHKHHWKLWSCVAALLFMIALGGSGYAYASHYSTVAVPGTKIGGINVAGMNRQEIISLIKTRTTATTIDINGDVQAEASLADLGITVDTEATADAALAPSNKIFNRFKALVNENNVKVKLNTNTATSSTYVDSLVPAEKAQATDATVVMGSEGASFTITPSAAGSTLDKSLVKAAANKAAETLSSQSIKLSYETVEPKVSDAQAQQIADQANQLLTVDISVNTADSETIFSPDAATKASWIAIGADADGLPSISVDGEKVSQWVAAQTAQIEQEPVTGVRNVNSRGDVVGTVTDAVNGVAVSNSEDVSSAITQALTAGKAYSGTFETSTVEAGWTERTIADGAENLVYQAADGEKWIDINLSSKTVTAYEGATIVHGPVSIVDGASETPTVTGTFKTYLQYSSQTMRGNNADGSTYVTPGVPWVTYFYGSYALHGAPWRSSFGYSGSHGCINMPVSEAQWIYDWAGIGTTVVSHY